MVLNRKGTNMRIIEEDEYQEIKNKMIYTGGKGNTGRIYKLDNLAIKIFLKPFTATQQVIKSYEILSNLQTNRFVMPKDIICKDNDIIGLTTEFIEDKKETLDNLDMGLLSKELKLIKNDIKVLNENKIALMDCYKENVMFSNGIYIIDTGEYQPLSVYPEFCKTLVKPNRSYTLENYNLFQVNSAVLYFLSNRLSDNIEKREKTKFILAMYDELKKHGGQFNIYVGDIIDEDKKDCKIFRQYVRKKI